MKSLYESILDSDEQIKDKIDEFILTLKLDKFSKDYLTEEQWKFIAAFVKSKFPQLYEVNATKGDYYNIDREKSVGRTNKLPNVDIRFKYSKRKVNNSNNLRVISYILWALRELEAGGLSGADRLEHSHDARQGIYNLHFSDRRKGDLRDPKPTDITPQIKEIMDCMTIEII